MNRHEAKKKEEQAANRKLDRAKGHKRNCRAQGPCGDDFWHVSCQCGWTSRATYHTRSSAIAVHRQHVADELSK